MTARWMGIAMFGVAAVCGVIAAITFPYGANDRVSALYIVSVAVGCAAVSWGVGLVIPKWRWVGVGFAVIVTLYAVGLAYVFVHELPS